MKIGVYTFQEGKEPKDLENKIKKLKKQLKIAVEALGLIDKRKCYMCNCLKGCPLIKYREKDNGCATCVSNACHKALKQIEELKQDD